MSATTGLPTLLGPRCLLRRPWARLTDAEWAELRAWLPGGDPEAECPRRGRKPTNLRRTVDAIFWIAASKGPWKALPPELGKPGSASRALRRWARDGVLEPLLTKLTHPDAHASPVLLGLAWWVARAFRRMARIVSTAALALAQKVLCLVDACPAWPLRLPDRNLSKTARAWLRQLNSGLKKQALQVAGAARQAPPAEHPPPDMAALRACVRAVRLGWAQLRLGVCGNRHQWRLK